MIGTTPNCELVGGHRTGFDPECAWCAGYTTPVDQVSHQVDPATVQKMDNGEAAALAGLNRLVTVYNEHQAQGVGHTAILLGLMAGLAAIYSPTKSEANDTLVGMLVTAVARIAELEARNARR